MDLYFSQRFGVDPQVLDEYGAFDISVVSDLPLFIDPFLLFNSPNPVYQELHEEIIEYLKFLKSKAGSQLSAGLIANLYSFKEVKQNWLGFTLLGNGGHALGLDFAHALHASLGDILSNFGEEKVTASSHLEKLALIRSGVGRDSISDFTTNLIKKFLLEYTQDFAKAHLDPSVCETFAVTRVTFNYDTESWATLNYYLPSADGDFVLLTPLDMLTRDDTWISQGDMVRNFHLIPPALPNDQLRAQVSNYFSRRLSKRSTAKEKAKAAIATIQEYPELIDYYIKLKEDAGDQAEAVSAHKVADLQRALVSQVKAAIPDIEQKSSFYDKPWTSYDEALDRVLEFKRYVEDQDGYRLINRAGQPFSQEKEVQLFFGLIWCKTDFDVNREPNNGRGPVDFKVSYGSGDKSLIEFKLASSSSLKRNLEKQVAIYEAANNTRTSVKVIICYTRADQSKVQRVIRGLKLEDEASIVVIDARGDNKPSASKA
jgi:hypothetical protein